MRTDDLPGSGFPRHLPAQLARIPSDLVSGQLRATRRLLSVSGLSLQQLARLLRSEPDPRLQAEAITRWARRVTEHLGIELRVAGPPPGPRVLLVANHQSYTDIPVLSSIVSCLFLTPSKSALVGSSMLRAAARRAGCVSLAPQSRRDSTSTPHGPREAIRRGVPVVVFPEEATSRGVSLRPFDIAPFALAADEKWPVVPVAIRYESFGDCWIGSDSFLRHFYERFSRRRMQVQVAFCPPLRHGDAVTLKLGAEAAIPRQLLSWSDAARKNHRQLAL